MQWRIQVLLVRAKHCFVGTVPAFTSGLWASTNDRVWIAGQRLNTQSVLFHNSEFSDSPYTPLNVFCHNSHTQKALPCVKIRRLSQYWYRRSPCARAQEKEGGNKHGKFDNAGTLLVDSPSPEGS